jgi:hypothetical protein
MPNFITLNSNTSVKGQFAVNTAHIESLHPYSAGGTNVYMTVVADGCQEYYYVQESVEEILDLIYQTPE